MRKRAFWTNGKKTVSGIYEWLWASQRFVIDFDTPIHAYGEKKRKWITSAETPEVGRWRLIRETAP